VENFRIALLALALSLSGCVAPGATSSVVCPSVATYTPAEEARIFQELTALPPDSVLHKVADEDYHLRVALMACRR
jgi:hypothetical protein